MSDLSTPMPAAAAGRAFPSLPDLLRVSRAGLIVSHLWAYLLPALFGGFRTSVDFWVALAYVTVPLGLLIYGWNDYFDRDIDRISRRKNNRATATVFGPRLERPRIAYLPHCIFAFQLPFAVFWAATGRLDLVGWMLLMALANALYNGPGLRLSRVPVLAELTATSIYMLIVWLGILVHSPPMPLWSWLFAALSILNLQIMGTLVDREADAQVGKRTLSVAFGATTSRVTVLVFLLAKTALTWAYTGNLAATAVMVAGVALVAGGLSIPRWRPSSTAYSSFLLLDWIWLGLLFAG